jgi:hypothetical protein
MKGTVLKNVYYTKHGKVMVQKRSREELPVWTL